MNNNEFSNQFDVLYNNIMSNEATGLNEYEKSVFLTKAQDEIVKNHFNPKSNAKTEGFDDTSKRQADFSMLMKTYHTNQYLTYNPSYKKFDPRSINYKLPDDLFIIVNESLVIDKNTIPCIGVYASTGSPTYILKYDSSLIDVFSDDFNIYKFPEIITYYVDSGYTATEITKAMATSYYWIKNQITRNKMDRDTIYHCIYALWIGEPVDLPSSLHNLSIASYNNSGHNVIDEVDFGNITNEIAKDKEIGDINETPIVEENNVTGIGKITIKDIQGRNALSVFENGLNGNTTLYFNIVTTKPGYIAGLTSNSFEKILITPLISNIIMSDSESDPITFMPEIRVKSGQVITFKVELRGNNGDYSRISSGADILYFIWRDIGSEDINFSNLPKIGIPIEFKIKELTDSSDPNTENNWTDVGNGSDVENSITMNIEEGYLINFGKVIKDLPSNACPIKSIKLNILSLTNSTTYTLEANLQGNCFSISPSVTQTITGTGEDEYQNYEIKFNPVGVGKYEGVITFTLKQSGVTNPVSTITCNLVGIGKAFTQVNPNDFHYTDISDNLNPDIQPLNPNDSTSGNTDYTPSVTPNTGNDDSTPSSPGEYVHLENSILYYDDTSVIIVGDSPGLIVVVNRQYNPEFFRKGVRTIIPISFTDYRRLMSKPYKEPLKWQAWRLITNNDDNNISIVEIIPTSKDKKYINVLTYDIRYIKRPRPIILADFSDSYGEDITIQNKSGIEPEYSNNGENESWEPCELDPILHEEILQRAVELAKVAWTGDANSNIQTGVRSE